MMKMKHPPTNIVAYAFNVLVAVLGIVVLAYSDAAEVDTTPQSELITSDQALAKLEEGNRRCIDGESSHGHDLAKWRERFLAKQKPFATILGCSDSRVAPELLFDQGFGDLFVIRVAGNIVDADVVGSIQYAVKHLDNKLIVVLGHQNCGAVTAALLPPDRSQDEPELQKLLDRIRAAIGSVELNQDQTQRIAAAVEANARASVKQLRKVPSIAVAMKERNVKIIGAIYQIDSGAITFLDE